MATYTDPALVEALLTSAIGVGSDPDLSAGQISDLLGLAMVDGAYTSEGMQRAAVVGWSWKSALTADSYDLSGGTGLALKESQWHAHCVGMALAYRTGAMSVDGLTLGSDLSEPEWGGVLTVTSNWATGPGEYA